MFNELSFFCGLWYEKYKSSRPSLAQCLLRLGVFNVLDMSKAGDKDLLYLKEIFDSMGRPDLVERVKSEEATRDYEETMFALDLHGI